MYPGGIDNTGHGSTRPSGTPGHGEHGESGWGGAVDGLVDTAIRQNVDSMGHPADWPGPSRYPDGTAHPFGEGPPHDLTHQPRTPVAPSARGFLPEQTMVPTFHGPNYSPEAYHQQTMWPTRSSHASRSTVPHTSALSPNTSPSTPVSLQGASQSALPTLPNGQSPVWNPASALRSLGSTGVDTLPFTFDSSAYEPPGSVASTSSSSGQYRHPSANLSPMSPVGGDLAGSVAHTRYESFPTPFAAPASELPNPPPDAYMQHDWYRPDSASSDSALGTLATRPRLDRVSLSDTVSPVPEDLEVKSGSLPEAPGRSRLDKRRNQNKLAQRAFRARTKAQQSQINNQIVELMKTNESQAQRLEEMTQRISTLQQENMNLKVAAMNASLPDGEKIVHPGVPRQPPDTGG